ncbi:MAG: hypothetical protein HWE10_01235 [Gammaproteobacteria bacterium]|nr:hypothetical protein [Gammaproteobacteria bacterium]
MKYNSHGDFEIKVEDNTIKITVNFAWNKECANEFVTSVKNVLENQMQASSFVVLCIIEEEWLPTSDSLSIFPKLTEWGVDKGMKKEAFLFKTRIAETLMLENLLAPLEESDCEFKSFKNESEARSWLKSPK